MLDNILWVVELHEIFKVKLSFIALVVELYLLFYLPHCSRTDCINTFSMPPHDAFVIHSFALLKSFIIHSLFLSLFSTCRD